MKARPQPLNNFPGDQIGVDDYTSKNSKNVDFNCIMNAFFDERKKSFWKLNNTTSSVQVRSKMKGWEAEINTRMANVEMSQAIGALVGLSPKFNSFCFLQLLM